MGRGKLYCKTLEMLINRRVSVKLTDIATATGLEIAWLKSFQKGKSDASSTRVEKLYEYLSGKELQI